MLRGTTISALLLAPYARGFAPAAGFRVASSQSLAQVRWHSARGHEDGGARIRTPEEEALSAAIQESQQAAARLSGAEEARTLVEYSTGFGVISTLSKKLEGYPNGAVVGFALDDQGRPIFSFSKISSHTSDLAADGRASLTVMSSTFKGAQDGRLTLIGDVASVPAEEKEAVAAIYRKKHPGAFWTAFGDFSYLRMDSIKAIRFVGGFAQAGDITPAEYMATKPDPITAFAAPVMSHMNDDHGSATTVMVKHYVTKGLGNVESAEIVSLDRLGMTVVVGINGEKGKLRLAFPRPAETRKDVKEILVEMTNASAAAAEK